MCSGTDDRQIELLPQAGLITEQDDKRYDRLRNGSSSIRDTRPRWSASAAACSAMANQVSQFARDPVFPKGRELYGLYEARQADAHPAHLLVVEGYMDVVALAQFGISNAVATLGTATTSEHLEAAAAPHPRWCSASTATRPGGTRRGRHCRPCCL